MPALFHTLTRAVLLAALVAGAAGCDLFEVDDRTDPNGPSRDEVLANPSIPLLSAVAIGVEASSRVGLGNYLTDVGVIGREYWVTSAADPRLTADLLGKGTSVLDNNTFYLTTPWAARYRTIRNANTLLEGLALNTTLSGEQKAAGRGWAKTWIGYQYLLNLNLTYQAGIRFIEPGQDAPGPFVGYDEALTRISALLDEGAADLASGGDAFFFPASGGLDGFDTPATFRGVNRALAARVALYRGDNAAALALVGDSFFSEAGNATTGAYHIFGTGSGDILNPFFLPQDNPASTANLAHPSFVSDASGADTSDTRLGKAFDRGQVDTFDGLSSQYSENVYTTSLTPIVIIRNAELRLIRAEARARTGDTGGAISDLDVIRTRAGLAAYSGGADQASVLTEVLRQRRYELYAEGHRWIDVRRFGLLDSLPIDREGDNVWEQFPIPEAEMGDV